MAAALEGLDMIDPAAVTSDEEEPMGENRHGYATPAEEVLEQIEIDMCDDPYE
jgi:hypothetical protein